VAKAHTDTKGSLYLYTQVHNRATTWPTLKGLVTYRPGCTPYRAKVAYTYANKYTAVQQLTVYTSGRGTCVYTKGAWHLSTLGSSRQRPDCKPRARPSMGLAVC